MIRVLVVEDLPLVRVFLVQILNRDPGIEVVATAGAGEEAIVEVERNNPDVITMDIHMPGMNGFDATRRIMETRPTPIIIVSGIAGATGGTNAFKAMEAGAVVVLQRPFGPGHPEHERTVADLVQTVKLMSEVRVVRRWPRDRSAEMSPPSPPSEMRLLDAGQSPPRLIAIGASTGGPPVIKTILSGLSTEFPVPILVVQHMAVGFTRGFVEWLAQSLRLPVELPNHGQHAFPGRVYVAPEGLHMTIGGRGQVWLKADGPEHGLRPAVSCLFRSVASAYSQDAVGILLTGMGKDGALELKLMKEMGALTIAQDRDSSAVHGMPGEAIRIGAATHVLSPERIRVALSSIDCNRSGHAPIPRDRDYA